MSSITYTPDNLVTSTVKLVTSSILQLESGQSVVRGEVLKKGTTGLITLTKIEYVEADATSATHVETSASTNLAQGDLIFHIAQVQMYEYVGATAAGVDLTAADFTNGGLYQEVSQLDTPYTVALQTIDASAGALDITYVDFGSVMNSELTYKVGSISDFRDGFKNSTRIRIEE